MTDVGGTKLQTIDGQAWNGAANVAVIAPGTTAAPSKTTPVDADTLPLVDSAASNVLKKLTWANLKAAIKSYYDDVTSTLTSKSISLGSNTITGTTAQFNTALSDNNFATLDGSETLTGKSISGSSNTLSNIAQSSVTSLTTDLAGKVPITRTVNSKALSSDVTLTQDDVASGTTNKVFTATEQTKLAGIAAGATANSSDATLLARANHTGTQAASTISDFSTAADARITNAIGTSVQAYDADLTSYAAISPTTLTQSLRANRSLTGGGTITVNASGYVYWSNTFKVHSNGRGSNFTADGFFTISCPTSGTVTGVGGASNKTATADGIPLGNWDALYYILPIGGENWFNGTNLRVSNLSSDVNIPHDWVLICIKNADNGVFSFNNGINLRVGESLNTVVQDTASTAHTLVRRDGSGNFAAGTISSSGVTVGGNPVGVKVAVPATATSTGVAGQWAVDSSYVYFATGTNTWVRAAVASW